MTKICDCKIIKNVYSKGDFQIYSCIPTTNDYDVVLSKYGNFTILGDLSMLEVGNEYKLELQEEDGKYGKQYRIVSIPSLDEFKIDNTDDLTPIKELELLKHIMTNSQADSVNHAYPHFIQMILNGEDNNIDYKKIPNVAEVRLASYIKKVTSLFKYYKIMQDNLNLSLSYSECVMLCRAYSSLEAIQEALIQHPYLALICVLHRPFPQIDNLLVEIYPKLKVSSQRCEFLLCYLLELNENDGNTRINGNLLAQYVIDWDRELLPLVKETSINSGQIHYDEDTKDLSLRTTYENECYIATTIKDKLNNPSVWNIDWTKYRKNEYITLTDEQIKILELICKYDFSMLVGNSGSGKSSSVKSIVEMLDDNGLSYTLLAPSGIASKRLRETTGRRASTIHKRILSGGNICSDIVLIDEISMCDVNLFATLLKQTEPNTKIVCVFDNAQLASIQCGNLVQDLLDSNIVPTARLTKVFRYGIGGISTVGTDARNGKSYLDDNGNLKCDGAENIKDYTFIPIGANPKEQVFSTYKQLLSEYNMEDILILTPFNVGAFGTYAINKKIQSEYNPAKPNENTATRKLKDAPNGIVTFRIGDKVINKKNNYEALSVESIDFQKEIKRIEKELENIKGIDGENSEPYYAKYDELNEKLNRAPANATIYNGDMGFIKNIDIDGNVYIQFDEDLIVYDKASLKNLLLAYACTSHSSQGCESKAVIFLTHPQHKKLLSKNLCYMSLTRAKERLIEIGDVSTINEALKISETQERNTYLKEKLLEA